MKKVQQKSITQQGHVLVFDGHEVHATPDSRFAAVDVLAAAGVKNAGDRWKYIKRKHPEFLEQISRNPFGRGGRPKETLTKEWALQLAMLANTPRGAELRAWLADVALRIERGDISIAVAVIEQNENPEELIYVARRAQTKATNKRLNATIKDHNGSGTIYGEVANIVNVTTTGMKAHELKEIRGAKPHQSARDCQDTFELAATAFMEEATRSNIVRQNCNGNPDIRDAAKSVAAAVIPLVSKFREKPLPETQRSLPAPRAETAPSTPLPARHAAGESKWDERMEPWKKHLRTGSEE